jgi:hypothetical protein
LQYIFFIRLSDLPGPLAHAIEAGVAIRSVRSQTNFSISRRPQRSNEACRLPSGNTLSRLIGERGLLYRSRESADVANGRKGNNACTIAYHLISGDTLEENE